MNGKIKMLATLVSKKKPFEAERESSEWSVRRKFENSLNPTQYSKLDLGQGSAPKILKIA